MNTSYDVNKIDQRLTQIDTLIQELQQEKQKLLLQRRSLDNEQQATEVKEFQSTLTLDQKVDLFASRFLGRQDVFAYRWESKKTGRSGYSVACMNEWQTLCKKPKIKCSDCQHRQLQTLSKQVVYDHLSGNKTIGVYPILKEPLNHCYFLALDFDKSDWKQSINAVREICVTNNLPCLVERSRSGNGGHIWFFFNQAIPANLARKFGTYLLDKALTIYPSLNFESYDRMFPNQDTLPLGGFGNLIALPLQRKPRNHGNSVFIDTNFEPFADQWFALHQVQPLTKQQLLDHVREVINEDTTLPKAANSINPIWQNNAYHQAISSTPHTAKKLPKASIVLIVSNQIFIPTKNLPNSLIAKIIQLASYNNPQFYKAQAMRFSTFGIPRRICLAHLENEWLSLPRGCFKETFKLLESHGVDITIEDKRQSGCYMNNKSLQTIYFNGTLTSDQEIAQDAILKQESGILQAPTGFGKTIVAIKSIASRKRNTLVLVHSKALLSQWQEKLQKYLTGVKIGIAGGNKKHQTLQVDVATYQSLLDRKNKDNKVKPIAFDYGYVIIDECHHISAPSFSLILTEIAPKFILGLTATPERQDGHHPIMYMLLGEIIFKAENQILNFSKKLLVQELNTDFPEMLLQQDQRYHVTKIFNYLATHDGRNQRILEDMQKVISKGRFPLLLTQRKDHATLLAKSLNNKGLKTVLLTGGLGKNQQQAAKKNLTNAKAVIATGRYVGEGFDLPRLDTLFLAMPVSWKGLVVQYLGRIHRKYNNKNEVQVYDYVDVLHPMLNRMYKRRLTAYRKEGYEL